MARRKSLLDQLTPSQQILAGVAILIIAGLVVAVRGWRERQPPAQPGQTLANRNVRFGMPAEAKADPASRTAYLIDRPQYVLSYNDATKNPNWVCWNLTTTDIGNVGRDPTFEPDPDLPNGFTRVKPADYNGSGFDRGHMCASKDRSDTSENNNILFYMTNIVPQAPNNNQKGWRVLEEHCRALAKQGNELYIACGPHGQGGEGRDGARHTHIGRATQIEVPESVWKVVLVLPSKEAVPTPETRAIAVWMPNDQSVTTDWKRYAVSVAEVEKRTGYKFFPLVPDDVASPIKGRVDTGP
ncbi:MAG: DNA/RNA non-specific endonuclease [Planctomycetes bacterium]|nr:DNA/RNA non-specific endonuclease [Planctomycetota bacterium]